MERIRDLWRECVLKHTKDPMNWQVVADEFAQLIILECTKAVMDGSKLGDWYAMQIEEHFDTRQDATIQFKE